MCNTTFRVFRIRNSFPTLISEVLLRHKFKIAATTILKYIYFAADNDNVPGIPLSKVFFCTRNSFPILHYKNALIHKFRMAATPIWKIFNFICVPKNMCVGVLGLPCFVQGSHRDLGLV